MLGYRRERARTKNFPSFLVKLLDGIGQRRRRKIWLGYSFADVGLIWDRWDTSTRQETEQRIQKHHFNCWGCWLAR